MRLRGGGARQLGRSGCRLLRRGVRMGWWWRQRLVWWFWVLVMVEIDSLRLMVELLVEVLRSRWLTMTHLSL